MSVEMPVAEKKARLLEVVLILERLRREDAAYQAERFRLEREIVDAENAEAIERSGAR